MIYLNLFLISIIVCFIVDISGIINNIKKIILKTFLKTKNPDPLAISLKPFDCSLCSVFWSCLIYLFIKDELSLTTIAFTSFLSLISSNISGFLQVLKEILTWIENKIYQKI